ncbi:transposase [Streptomyces sp. SID13666]|nr:transposase [Streptomyces sp. SID13666]NEA69180.1 transposase [Streptomyces sp. SID13588]
MWSRIEPLIPADPVCGRRRADHRRTLETIAWQYRANSPCRDLPDARSRSRRTRRSRQMAREREDQQPTTTG